MLGRKENPVAHIVQILAISHLLQLSEDKHATHLIPFVILHVCPVAQHPYEGLGRKEKPDLQDAH